MSSVVISGDTSGAITLAAPAVSGTNTATLPAATGTVMVSGNMPAFSAYQTSATAVTGSATKILFDTEEFDTNNNFASSRFTPTVAGYYQINAQLQGATTYSGGFIGIYKNGSVYKYGNYANSVTVFGGFLVSTLVYCNGSTDYLEVYGAFTTNQNTSTGLSFTYFNGSMVRGA